MKEKSRNIKLTKGKAKIKEAVAITSKSYGHRLIIASALCKQDVEIITNIMSKDMEATINACETLERGGEDMVIDCGESGSTARFILPVAALCAKEALITGSGRLPERPMGPLCDVLRAAGVTVSGDHLPISVSGMPHSGVYPRKVPAFAWSSAAACSALMNSSHSGLETSPIPSRYTGISGCFSRYASTFFEIP